MRNTWTFWLKPETPPKPEPIGQILLESGKKINEMTDVELGVLLGYLKTIPYAPAPLKSWAEADALAWLIRAEVQQRIESKYK